MNESLVRRKVNFLSIMRPKSNPFTANNFVSNWNAYFNSNGEGAFFKGIEGIGFVKSRIPKLYTNIGGRMTQGMSYSFCEESGPIDLKGKVFLIYDVPDYFDLNGPSDQRIKLIRSKQYDGYLSYLVGYNDIDSYLSDHLKGKSKRLVLRSKRRLESSFNVRYEVLIGPEVTGDKYQAIFSNFRELLEKRYTAKNEIHPMLLRDNWNFLKDLVLPMIRDKKAALFALYANDQPIAINLNYLSDKVVFSSLPVFDIDYSSFNLGHIMTLWHIDWCIKNNYQIYDFSKGYYDYKKRWGNRHYFVDYHLIFDSRSIYARILAWSLYLGFELKNHLRRYYIDDAYEKLSQKLRKTSDRTNLPVFGLQPVDNPPDFGSFTELNIENHPNLRRPLLDYLYKYQESYLDVRILQDKKGNTPVYVQGKDVTCILRPIS